jgi:hypothetical protein
LALGLLPTRSLALHSGHADVIGKLANEANPWNEKLTMRLFDLTTNQGDIEAARDALSNIRAGIEILEEWFGRGQRHWYGHYSAFRPTAFFRFAARTRASCAQVTGLVSLFAAAASTASFSATVSGIRRLSVRRSSGLFLGLTIVVFRQKYVSPELQTKLLICHNKVSTAKWEDSRKNVEEPRGNVATRK